VPVSFSILLFWTIAATAQVAKDGADSGASRPLTTAPKVTRTSPSVSSAASSTDAAIEREALRQRDIRSFLIRPLYRDPTHAELAGMAVNSSIRDQFAAFLRLPNTGITKLLPDIGCIPSSRTISASPECMARSIPGGGSAFSFRKRNYTIRKFADLFLSKGVLSVAGQYSQAAIASLGSTPVEAITLEDLHVRAVTSIPQATTIAEAQQLIQGDLFRSFVPKEGTSYAMRYIAYRGEIKRSVRGVVYNELKYDRRSDIVVAFSIVSHSAEGTIIIWHVLSDNKSPELKK